MTVVDRRSPWLALAVLTLINLVNYLDRYVVPAVADSIMRSPLHPNGAEFGFLTSAFFLVYLLAAPLFGAYGDRPWRLRLVAAGVALWSVATAAAGFAQTYSQLLAARASVGIGEAAYSAIAPAVLADSFPERLRGRIYAVFYAAIPVGSALGYLVGGVVDHAYGWRAAFFVAGIPGLVLAVLTLGLVNPAPGAADERPSSQAAAAPPARGFRTYVDLLFNAEYRLVVLGLAAYTFAFGGIAAWMPLYLQRVRGLSGLRATGTLSPLLVVTGFIGTFVGGWIGDRLQRRTARGYLWLSGATMILATPLVYVALTAAAPATYWPALAGAVVLLFMSTSPINAVIVGSVPPASRAAAMAASIFVIHALGDVPAPTIIGRISDATSLGRAVLLIPVVVLISGAIWLYAAGRGGDGRGRTAG